MLNDASAGRLARRASRLRADGSRGARARWAWGRLARAGDRGNADAITWTWEAWARAPTGAAAEDLWRALSRWQDPHDLAEAVFEAATDPHRSPSVQAALGEFCAQHGLVPQDAVRRAVFYVMTGQGAQHRAADPDGRLLAAGYGIAGELTRLALVQALARAGDLDIVRVVVGGQPGGAGALTAPERDYLTQHFRRGRDWAGLWGHARDLPLAEAVAAAQLIRDGWLPSDDRDRAVLSRLAAAEPETISRSAAELAKPVVIFVDTDGISMRGSFSPDGRQLLVAVARYGRDYSGVRVYDLPGRSLLERHDYPGTLAPPAVVHLGTAFVVVGRRQNRVWELVRYADGQPHVFHWSRRPMTACAHPAGLAVLEKLEPGRRWRLAIYNADGAVLSDSELELGATSYDPAYGYQVAADPASGRMVVSGRGLWVLAADGSAVLAAAQESQVQLSSPFSGACFTGPDSVVALAPPRGHVGRYRIAGNRLVEQAVAASWWPSSPGASLTAIPHRGEVAVGGGNERVRYWDAESLTEKSHPEELDAIHSNAFWGSPDGRSQALDVGPAGQRKVRVIWGEHAAARQLAGRAMGSMTPADLAAATAARRSPVPGTATWPFLDLLRDCLELRFATDVGLGDARPAAGDDDVGLSAAGEWSG